MKRRLELFSIVLFALNAGVVGGGVTSALADEAGVEVDLGDLRGEILSLFAPRSSSYVCASLVILSWCLFSFSPETAGPVTAMAATLPSA